MVQLVIQPREPFEPGFLRRPCTFFYARLKRLAKLVPERPLRPHRDEPPLIISEWSVGASRRWEYSYLARSLGCFAIQNLLGSHNTLTGGSSILDRKSLGRQKDRPPFWSTWLSTYDASQTPPGGRRFEEGPVMTTDDGMDRFNLVSLLLSERGWGR